MIEITRQEDHFHANRGWLTTDWHFSFGNFYDPERVRFGPLRVVNNDRVQGGGGFPMHSHEDMEILTWIIEGELVHEDSTGSKGRLTRNEIQRMSAGTGISHSEYNGSDSELLHLLQIWIEPDRKGVEPAYGEEHFEEEQLQNRFEPVASGQGEGGVDFHQDATMYVSHLEEGASLNHEFDPRRRGYLVCISGTAELEGQEVEEGDAAKLTEESSLELVANGPAEILLIDLP